VPVLGWLFCCACGGAAAASANGAATTPAPAAPNAAVAPTPPAARAPLPLAYSAPESCPSVDGYLSDVRARASNLTLDPAAAAGDESVDVRVELASDASGWLGHVTIAGPNALEREVRGERCEDVVAALALITVLRLEGSDASARRAAAAGADAAATGVAGATAATSSAGAPSATPSAASSAPNAGDAATAAQPSAPAAPATPESPTAAPAPDEPRSEPLEPGSSRAEPTAPVVPSTANESPATTPEAAASERDEPAPARSDDDQRTASNSRADEPEALGRGESAVESSASDDAGSATSARETESTWEWPSTSAGLAAIAGYSTVPSHAFRGALGAELRIGEGRSSWLSSLSFAYARGNDTVDPGDLGLTLLTLELALCPPSIIAEPSVWISACASARAGRVRLAFTSTLPDVDARETWRPWVAVGPSLRVGVPLSEHWALRGVAELAVQLVRDTFAVRLGAADDADADVLPLYRPEAVSIEVGAGIGYSF